MKNFKNKMKLPEKMVFTHFQHKLAVVGFLVTGYLAFYVPYYSLDTNKKEEK